MQPAYRRAYLKNFSGLEQSIKPTDSEGDWSSCIWAEKYGTRVVPEWVLIMYYWGWYDSSFRKQWNFDYSSFWGSQAVDIFLPQDSSSCRKQPMAHFLIKISRVLPLSLVDNVECYNRIPLWLIFTLLLSFYTKGLVLYGNVDIVVNLLHCHNKHPFLDARGSSFFDVCPRLYTVSPEPDFWREVEVWG